MSLQQLASRIQENFSAGFVKAVEWRGDLAVTVMRDRLKAVAALVPADTAGYLQSFRDHAQSCFADFLYDDATAGDGDAYNPPPDDWNGVFAVHEK